MNLVNEHRQNVNENFNVYKNTSSMSIHLRAKITEDTIGLFFSKQS